MYSINIPAIHTGHHIVNNVTFWIIPQSFSVRSQNIRKFRPLEVKCNFTRTELFYYSDWDGNVLYRVNSKQFGGKKEQSACLCCIYEYIHSSSFLEKPYDNISIWKFCFIFVLWREWKKKECSGSLVHSSSIELGFSSITQ